MFSPNPSPFMLLIGALTDATWVATVPPFIPLLPTLPMTLCVMFIPTEPAKPADECSPALWATPAPGPTAATAAAAAAAAAAALWAPTAPAGPAGAPTPPPDCEGSMVLALMRVDGTRAASAACHCTRICPTCRLSTQPPRLGVTRRPCEWTSQFLVHLVNAPPRPHGEGRVPYAEEALDGVAASVLRGYRRKALRAKITAPPIPESRVAGAKPHQTRSIDT